MAEVIPPMKTYHSSGALLCAFFFAQSISLFAQGSLTPPGAPAPTMKTLDQVEPRIAINATNTPGDSDSVFKITQPGSYYLTSNMTGVASKHGIEIAASNVTIDLNGFTVQGVAGSFDGITNNGVAINNIRVFNGVVAGWGQDGLQADNGFNQHFERIHARGNGAAGFIVDDNGLVESCTASSNGAIGIRCGQNTVVRSCAAYGNTSTGIFLLHGAVENCTSGTNLLGFSTGAATTVTNCTARDNTNDGVSVSNGSVIQNCAALGNGGNGFFAGDGSTLINCTATGNLGTDAIQSGVGSTLVQCTAHSNSVEFGIRADDRSTLTNCTASLNTSAATDSWGISAGVQCTISNCSVNGNLNTNGTPTNSTGGGILAGGSSTVSNCTVVGNKGDGIQIGSDARVIGNNCDSNGFGGGDAAGIHSTGADTRIESNNVTDNVRGIDVDAAGNLIIKNSASGNGTNYDIVASNRYGPIVDITAAGAAAVIGSSAADTTTTTHPWANFSY
jgi:parallel beta-helix repeat protein